MAFDVRRFDIYRKIPKDLTQPTLTGAIVSICCCIFMTILFLSEFYSYISPDILSELFVDSNANSEERILVRLNITLPKLGCDVVGLDIQDDLGRHEVGFVENTEKIPFGDSGCQFNGRFYINKVPGNFHVSTHSATTQPESIDMAHSIQELSFGDSITLAFIILAGISACLYFLFLCYMVYKVFCNISHKRTTLPSMSSARRLFYEGVIYRFKFLMLATLLCAALTVIFFIVGQVSEGRWKWDDELHLEYTSAFFCGVYGMWNIYVFALIVLYSPSHKRWPIDSDLRNSSTEEIEFSRLPTEPTEISTLTSFSKKAAAD